MNQIENTITSLEVAEMMEMKHYQILEKLEGTKTIKGIIPTMCDHKIMVADYFRESTYKDAQGKDRKCYEVTKLGCDFLANKFTGEKGIIFTAKYVKRFRDMEDVINQPKKLSALQQLQLTQEATLELNEKVNEQERRMDRLEYDIPLYGCEAKELSDKVKRKGVDVLGGKKSNAYKDNGVRSMVYRDIYDQLKREFGICDSNGRKQTYSALKRKYLEDAFKFVSVYEPSTYIEEQINYCNAQMNITEE